MAPSQGGERDERARSIAARAEEWVIGILVSSAFFCAATRFFPLAVERWVAYGYVEGSYLHFWRWDKSWGIMVAMSAWMKTPFWRLFLPSFPAEMSTWMNFAVGDHFGGSPKWRIQFRRAPRRRTTSASFRAVLRALAVLRGCHSGRTPLPMGVGRKGIWVRATSVWRGFDARP